MVARNLGNALRKKFGDDFVGHETAYRLGASWVLGGGQTKTTRQGLVEDPIEQVMLRWNRQLARPVVLMIDEFQNIVGSKDSLHAKVLHELHEATYKLPILPVVAGLSGTVERSTELGLTRLGSNHVVAGLDADEAIEAIASWAERFRVPLDPERGADGRHPWQDLVLRLVHDSFVDVPLPPNRE